MEKTKFFLNSIFFTKIETQMTHLVFLFCYLLSLCFQRHLEAVLSTFNILSCTINNKKYEKTGESEARPSELEAP